MRSQQSSQHDIGNKEEYEKSTTIFVGYLIGIVVIIMLLGSHVGGGPEPDKNRVDDAMSQMESLKLSVPSYQTSDAISPFDVVAISLKDDVQRGFKHIDIPTPGTYMSPDELRTYYAAHFTVAITDKYDVNWSWRHPQDITLDECRVYWIIRGQMTLWPDDVLLCMAGYQEALGYNVPSALDIFPPCT